MITTPVEPGSITVKLFGVKHSPAAYAIRDFLQRSVVAFRTSGTSIGLSSVSRSVLGCLNGLPIASLLLVRPSPKFGLTIT